MTKIILVRHGHVEGIDPPRFRGRTELPLTEIGMRQAQQTAQRIAAHWKPLSLYTSPMGRKVEAMRTSGLNPPSYLPSGSPRPIWCGFRGAILCRISSRALVTPCALFATGTARKPS